MQQKKIMLLGGNAFQMSATIRAKELGYYVISCDYLPDNPAHKYADEYHNVSTLDKEKVLDLAKKLNIDGIMSYASDVSATTVAYVAEELGLPGNPLKSIEILTNKDLFRDFMTKYDFNTPACKAFIDYEEAAEYIKTVKLPVMVKPIDSSGSKGLTKLTNLNDFEKAFCFAQSFSQSKKVLIEEFIERKGKQLEIEGFIVDGKIKFACPMDQHCDPACTLYSPIGSSVPSTQSPVIADKAIQAAQRVFNLLGMRFGSFNYEYIVDANDNVYIMEIGPRNGGNFIPDMIKAAKGIDLAEYAIKSALGEPCDDLCDCPATQCVSSYLVHSLKDGVFKELYIDEKIKPNIVKECIYVKPGDEVEKFKDARMGLGCFVIKFDSVEEKSYMMDHMNEYIKVITE